MKTVRNKTLLAGISADLMLAISGLALAQPRGLPTQPKNLDFESPAAASGWPADWGGGPAGYEPGVDQKVVHGGKQSGRIRFAGTQEAGGPAFGTLVQGFDPEAYRGQRIRYSGYVRSEKAEGGGAALWMRVDGAKPGDTLAFDNMQGRAITGTTEWKKCEIVLDVPKEAATISFGALLAGKGTAWVDDLQIEKVDASVPITDLTKQPLPTQPKNLDFESPAAASGSPADWGGGPAGYEPGVDQKVVHGGKQSGRIRFAGTQEAGGPAFGTLVQGFDPEAYRGQRIRYSGYVRSEKAEGGGAALWMRVDGAKPGDTLAFDNMHGRAITGTTEWKKCEIVLDVPKEAATISFGALLAGKGTAWVDDLQIEKVDASVPITDLTKRMRP
jgi:hypothetical protein